MSTPLFFNPRARTLGGFTLLELLVALSVFAVVSVMAYTGLRVVLDARASTDLTSRQIAELQTTLVALGRDLEHMVARPIRDSYGDTQLPMRYSPYASVQRLEFVRTGMRSAQQRSSLQRIAWELHEGQLTRLTWRVLDGGAEDDYMRTIMIGMRTDLEITEFAVYFYTPTITTRIDTWPPPGLADPPLLPSGIEIELELEGMGRINRLFAVNR